MYLTKFNLLILSLFVSVLYSQTTIRMTQKGGVFTVPCKVNGLNLEFIFDTGASSVSLSKAEAIFMLKNGYLSKNDFVDIEHYSLANGDVEEGFSIILREVEFAGLKLYNVEASIVNNMSAPLLLGQSVIQKLGPIVLNGSNLQILNGKTNTYTYTYENTHKNKHSTGSKVEQMNNELQQANKAAMDAYNAKNYAVAAPKFAEVYNLLKSVGQDNKQYLYYSAITYALAKDNDNAIKTYKTLIDSGYTGVETKYLAKNKKSGEVENLDKNSWDLLKKANSGEYSDFKTETSPSVEEELYETLVALQSEVKAYDDVIVYSEKGLKKFPKNSKLNNAKGLAYYNSGKMEQFITNLKETVAKEPNNKDAWYNLGVMTSKDPAKQAEAEGYFKKAVEIDPKFANAWQNLTFLTIGDDEKTIDTYNQLRKSGKIDQANKVIEERRKRLAASLPYAEKWYESAPDDIDAVIQLKGLYTSLKMEAKAKEFKAKEDAMKK